MKFYREGSIFLLLFLLGFAQASGASAASYVEFAWMKVMDFASTGGETK